MSYCYDLALNKISWREGSELMADHVARQVGYTEWEGGWWVSTVFLVIDHGFGLTDKPVLWETMAFNPSGYEEYLTRRYTSREDAEHGHAEVVGQVQVAMTGLPVEAGHEESND